MTQPIEETITVNERPGYAEWLKTLKAKTEQAARQEQEELQWRQRYGKT